MAWTRFLLTSLLLTLVVTPSAAKEYRADRFDARIEVLNGGSLRVTETVVFTFTDGTFTEVFRVIPTRRTDGVEFIDASMDGRTLPQGDGPGHVRVRRKNGLRVEWHFERVSNSTHTFQLTYVARGVVRAEGDRDFLAWRALPTEHRYPIASATIEIIVPAEPQGELRLERRRVDGEARIGFADGRLVISGTSIRRDGWLQPEIGFARGAILDGLPAWQQRAENHRRMIPTWLLIAGGILVIGMGWLALLRHGYDTPPPATPAQWTSVIPPDGASPALAGALVANGSPQLEHAMGLLLTLAERGIVHIREEGAALGQRDFVITSHLSHAAHTPLSALEQALLESMFADADRSHGVKLSKARSRLMHRFGRFRDALRSEMKAEGLFDAGRHAHRRRYQRLGLAFLGLAAVAVVPVLVVLQQYGGWPLFIPLALALVGGASFIFAAAETPLSNEGVRRAELWRGYQRHLRKPQEIEPRWGGSAAGEAHILPYAVALGLASAWSKFMKKRGVKAPSWFEARADHEQGTAFATFIAYGGAGAHGGGAGAGAGGVAGGGASGAR